MGIWPALIGGRVADLHRLAWAVLAGGENQHLRNIDWREKLGSSVQRAQMMAAFVQNH
jgi:hypothetical protein